MVKKIGAIDAIISLSSGTAEASIVNGNLDNIKEILFRYIVYFNFISYI